MMFRCDVTQRLSEGDVTLREAGFGFNIFLKLCDVYRPSCLDQ